MFNNMGINPAVAGSLESVHLFGIFRTQNTGFDGAPKTSVVSAHAPLNRLNSGVGLSIVNDDIGQNVWTGVNLAYAYKIAQGTDATLNVGPSIGFVQQSVMGSKFKAGTSGDNAFPNTDVNKVVPDLGIGAYYYKENLNVGLSISHFIQNKFKYDNGTGGTSEYDLKRHFFLTAGYLYNLNSKIDIKPSIIIKSVGVIKTPQPEINALLYYNQKLWGGLSYRNKDAIVALVGLKVNDKLQLGYSYDFTTTKLGTASNGSHEIFISYDIFVAPKQKDNIIIRTPRYL